MYTTRIRENREYISCGISYAVESGIKNTAIGKGIQTQRNTTQRNTTQYNAIQRNTTQYNAIQRNTTQYNAIQRNTTFSTTDALMSKNKGNENKGIDRSIDHSPRDYRSKWETEIGQQIDCGHVLIRKKGTLSLRIHD